MGRPSPSASSGIVKECMGLHAYQGGSSELLVNLALVELFVVRVFVAFSVVDVFWCAGYLLMWLCRTS